MKSGRWITSYFFSGPAKLVGFVLIMLQEPVSASYQIMLRGSAKYRRSI
jgi:hypothetical protein